MGGFWMINRSNNLRIKVLELNNMQENLTQ